MTDRPLSISMQIAPPIQTAFNPPLSISAIDAPSATDTLDDSTIKCICGFNDDDGSTIFCENCSTWQHIECFYPGRAEEALDDKFEHHCADCKPRPLDRKRATEWQRNQIESKGLSDLNDKKPKRPPSKSHKKKPRLTDVQVNGVHDHDGHRNKSPQDQPHTKKSKGHRSTQSISSQMKRSPPYNARPNPNNHPPSPAHTPPDLPADFTVHTYSDAFQHLYDDDHPFQRTSRNTFTREAINCTAEWLRSPQKLCEDTGVQEEKDVIQRIIAEAKLPQFPELLVTRKELSDNETVRLFRDLRARTAMKDGIFIGELNGLVGLQKDYCAEPTSQWSDLVHPLPFVFFPSTKIPLYIDTRNEGSDARYARRSCRSNTLVEPFLTHGVDYRFWLVSERQIDAGEQITLPWNFCFPPEVKKRYLHLLNLDVDPTDRDPITDDEYTSLADSSYKVLSEYGGCACELGNDCAFARFHRSYYGRSHGQSNGTKSKKARKPKHSHVSPTSTGHATNSRAASEGQDQDDDEDSRSVSGSVRSKPQSRDLTPIHDVSANGVLEGVTEREKRKIAQIEERFKEEKGQPQRKKKRTSEGSTMSGAASMTPQPQSKPRQRSVAPRASIPQLANGSRTSKYVDASTSRRESDSPYTAGSPPGAAHSPGHSLSRGGSVYRSRQVSMTPKNSYAEASTQTEAVDDAWWSEPVKARPKRPIISLSKRLLRNRLKLQPQIDARRASMAADASVLGSPTMSMDVDGPGHEDRSNPSSPVEARGRNPSIASSTPSIDASATDVAMTDAPAILIGSAIKPPPPPWPGQSNAMPRSNSIPSHKAPDLRVQMPGVPAFVTPNMVGTPTGNTPSSATGSISQSPFGTNFPPAFPAPIVNGALQSPAKAPKKLSLSDYKARQAKKEAEKPSAGSSPTIAPAVLNPSLSTIDEVKTTSILEGSVLVDTPASEKLVDPIASIVEADSTSKDNLPLPNGTL